MSQHLSCGTLQLMERICFTRSTSNMNQENWFMRLESPRSMDSSSLANDDSNTFSDILSDRFMCFNFSFLNSNEKGYVDNNIHTFFFVPLSAIISSWTTRLGLALIEFLLVNSELHATFYLLQKTKGILLFSLRKGDHMYIYMYIYMFNCSLN